MKKKLVSDISANSLQVIINQLSGLAIFYILSTQLNKNQFGEINWTLAVLLTLFSILSFGIDQVVIKKIAAGNNINATLAAYIMHVLFSGLLVYTLLVICNFLFGSFFQLHQLLLLIGAGKLMLFFATPFKQLANGLEKFKSLLFMSICSNLVRSVALIFLAFTNYISLQTVIIVFIAGDCTELLLCLFITKYRLKIPVTLQWNKANYAGLLKESLPQLGVAIFNAAIARFDWIFLGLLTSTIVLANYSFAYKVFEMATVPLLVIAPILIPRFTKLFAPGNEEVPAAKMNQLLVLLRFEIIIACGMALLLNILWAPVIDFITQNKYGAVNTYTILFLSACMPFLYFNNFLWTISFTRGNLKTIFYIFLICFIVNITATVTAIPFFSAEGAAAAYLFATIIQSLLFYYHCAFNKYSSKILSMLLILFYAAGAGVLATRLFNGVVFTVISAVCIYLAALILSGLIKRTDWQLLKQTAGF
jgi:O-antigen/teichoic acid export membrane protein